MLQSRFRIEQEWAQKWDGGGLEPLITPPTGLWTQQAMSYEDYQLLWETRGVVGEQEGGTGVGAEGSPGQAETRDREGRGVEVGGSRAHWVRSYIHPGIPPNIYAIAAANHQPRSQQQITTTENERPEQHRSKAVTECTLPQRGPLCFETQDRISLWQEPETSRVQPYIHPNISPNIQAIPTATQQPQSQQQITITENKQSEQHQSNAVTECTLPQRDPLCFATQDRFSLWQEPMMSPIQPYIIHQQPQEGPNRDRGTGGVDRAKGGAKREREEGIDLEGLVDWRPRGQTVGERQPQKRLRLGRGPAGGWAEGCSTQGLGVAGEAEVGTGWQTGRGVAVEEQYRTRHSTGQGIAGEAAVGARRHRVRRLGIEQQGGVEQSDRTGIG
jgi:hypothetical protein